jgi:hypothetical protein
MRLKTTVAAVAILALVTMACSVLEPADAAMPSGNGVEQRQYSGDAFEVAVFDSPNHRGRSETYTLDEGSRQIPVQFVGWDMNDRISSIRVGYRVGVILFNNRNFSGAARVYFDTVTLLEREFNDEVSSLIVFNREIGEPLGVLLGQGMVSENALLEGDYPETSHFYPLPQEFEKSEQRIKLIEDFNDQAEWAYIADGARRHFRGGNVEAILYEHDKFRGNSLSLPPSGRNDRSLFLLDDFGFNRKASSLIILERGGGRRR